MCYSYDKLVPKNYGVVKLLIKGNTDQYIKF